MEQNPGSSPAVNVAIYARDAQGDKSSLDHQIRECKSYADRMGWRIDDTHVFTDIGGVSGTTATARPGLTRLLEAVHRVPPPFATVLTSNSSRIGRAMSDVIDIFSQLEFQGVSLSFAEQGLNSSDNPEYFREALGVYADFRKSLGHSVRRGQKARVAKGFVHGGRRRFGYNHTLMVDPTRMIGGRPMVAGVKATINPVEAAVVRRIFDLRASGLSYRRIADMLAADNWSTGSNLRKWTASTVLATVNNPIYLGHVVYGRTRSRRHWRTGKIWIEHLPPAEWMDREFPELRIVTDEQWRKAADVNLRNGDIQRTDNSDPRV